MDFIASKIEVHISQEREIYHCYLKEELLFIVYLLHIRYFTRRFTYVIFI